MPFPRFSLILLSAAFVLTGCATGNDFARPTTTAVSLGVTTKSDLIATFGRPREEKTTSVTLNPVRGASPSSTAESGLATTLFYSFVNPGGEAAEGISPQKAAYFYMWNDRLMAYKYTSSFKSDSTAFPVAFISRIEKKKTTEKEAVAIFGQPSGHGIYPYASDPASHTLTYYNFAWDRAKREFSNKELRLLVDADGVITDYRYEDSVKPISIPPPAAVPYFVTAPVKR